MLQQGSRVSPPHDVKSRGRILGIRKETHDEEQFTLRNGLPRCPVARVRWEFEEPEITNIRLDRLVEIEEKGNGSTPDGIQP